MNLLKKLLVPAALIANAFNGYAQTFDLIISPTTQVIEIGQTANFTIKARGIDGFNGQIFLKVSESDNSNFKFELSSDLIFSPYTETPTLSITPFSTTQEKSYSITIEAFNGLLSLPKSIIVEVKKENCIWKNTALDVSFVDNKGEYWGGSAPSIYKSNIPTAKYALPNYEYRSRFIDADNNFWYATDKGIVKFDGKSATVLNASNDKLPIDVIFFVIVDSNKTIWIADRTSLYKKIKDNWQKVSLNVGEINDLKLDRKNNVWVSSSLNYQGTLIKIEEEKISYFNNINSCLPQTGIGQINFDINNALWAGLSSDNNINNNSKENSILKYDGNTWEYWCRKATKPYNHYLYDNACKLIVNDNASGYDAFYMGSVTIDGNNNKWILVNSPGGNNGLIKYNDNTWKNFNSSEGGARPYGNINNIAVSTKSKKVFMKTGDIYFVYEDCEKPLATDANITMAANTVTISQSANNQFLIQSQQNIDGLVLMNMNGTELSNEVAKTNTVQVDYSAYPSGLYLVKVISNNQVVTKKLMIQ